ncbi:MAG: 4Fe-4S binding protein [Bacillota bacterium]
MPQVFFDKERCKGCELCISVCPKKIIALSPEVNSLGLHPAAVTDSSKCTGCGFCFFVCPDLVVTVLREEESDG